LLIRLIAAFAVFAVAGCAQTLSTVSGPLSDLMGKPFVGSALFTLQDVVSNGVPIYSPPIKICSPGLQIANCTAYTLSGGVLTVTLVANQSATPNGTSYTVTMTPYVGIRPQPSYTRYWSVGTSGPYTITQVLTGQSVVNPDLRGPTGPQGATGAVGPASTVPGPQGVQGVQGVQGAVGATGAASTVPGPAGAAGPVGATGAAGNTILSGAGSPSGGVNGNFFIDTSVPCIYGPKASGLWPMTCTPMVGPAGSNGAVGMTGPTGPASLTPTGTGFPTVTGGALNSAARLLNSGDIPNNAANTTGSAGFISTLPGFVLFTGNGTSTLALPNAGSPTYTFPTGGNLINDTDSQALTNKTLDTISPTKMGYLFNLTGDLQTTLNLKQPIITTGPSSDYLKADLSIGHTCNACTTGAPVCWNGTAFYTVGCAGGGGGGGSWGALTSGTWSGLTSGAWAALTI
jgi:hypothetical protein